VTNGLHGFYYRELNFRQVGPYIQLVAQPGPAYNFMICFFALILTYVLFYVFTHRATIQRVFHRQLNLTLYSMSIFLLYNMLWAINLPLIQIPILGQLSIIPGIIFCLYTFQKNMLHLQPISIEKPMEELIDGILSFSGEGIVVDLNNQMCRILNKPWRKVAGHSLQESFPEFHAKLEEVGLFPTNPYDSRRTVSHFVFEYGKYGFDTHIYFSNRYIRVTMHDVSEFLRKVDKESSLAAHDPLTGILNRRHSEQTIKKLLADTGFGDAPYCFIVFDIDYFKQINDNFGHQTGDVILKEITHLFNQSIRPTDVFGRFGGDEFILLLHQVNQDQAISILNRIQKSIKGHPFRSDDGEAVHPTISIGAITSTTAAELPYADLFYLADEALYQAKEKGRDQIVVRHHASYTKATYL
jgi:diguanylate cyclase (GGDEF)-like protein